MCVQSLIWTAVVTGASSGFARSMTELVLAKGDIAVATLRKPEVISDLSFKYTSKQLLVLKLDVSKPAEVVAAFDAAVKAFGRIDVVFNNAGYNVLGEVEATSEQIARGVFDVNFFGAVNVSKDAVRIFRDVNKPQGGRLSQMSSGVVYYKLVPLLSTQLLKAVSIRQLCLTRHKADRVGCLALNAISDALAVEVDPEWNIKAC